MYLEPKKKKILRSCLFLSCYSYNVYNCQISVVALSTLPSGHFKLEGCSYALLPAPDLQIPRPRAISGRWGIEVDPIRLVAEPVSSANRLTEKSQLSPSPK